MAVNKARQIAAEQRRSKVIQMKRAGASEAAIAEKVGVSQQQVHKDIVRRLGEVRREDKESVDRQWVLQNSRGDCP